MFGAFFVLGLRGVPLWSLQQDGTAWSSSRIWSSKDLEVGFLVMGLEPFNGWLMIIIIIIVVIMIIISIVSILRVAMN